MVNIVVKRDSVPELVSKISRDFREFNDDEALFIIGGDGTFIYGVGGFEEFKVPPIYAFNIGSVGALLPLNPRKYEAIAKSIKSKKMNFIKRNRLRINAEARSIVNEAVIYSKFPRLVRFSIAIGAESIDVNGDSVIIATRSGSSGHSASVGGSILLGDYTIISVVGANNCNFRSLVVPAESQIRVRCTDCYCQIDGRYDAKKAEEYVISLVDWYFIAVEDEHRDIDRVKNLYYSTRLKPASTLTM